ncbi:tRNA (adenosine(37)-N6)-threonylcarbamoyltransferase complex ATPase subunit type 1 TsaE [Nocardioides sp. zg-536]|uniref:tRNA threonylcarbamoyladenosine biosynthesis protein TsaE n=1 Tax=Nocardioides faecalis TaxID=2803858 RepID=A0A939BYB2_9ACTN|nr:tRNA (adenosine(37)-N6)-threonylcarbamoyltransferase complex ATPase subunit type 1 TsaE [Nocardioides faecalis]MBM9459745.1 tRNA (adenosine(37)-N6)-threonylcarbamoyltransferase complex ATPase subunit type 1 TsaE [Nocardioides faecalis]QVI58261.1 tRNA (adenosine(37)-N6)-threonylcarbamoyltransferase complex ATPase subunit type 1 TsaE [Nocardioides faecalis]
MTVEISLVGPEAADDALEVVRTAFAARAPLDPPADALSETAESIAAMLAPGGGLLARLDGCPVGVVVLDPDESAVFLRRFGVVPQAQGRGIARALVRAALSEVAARAATSLDPARAPDRLVVLAREELPRTVGFWRDMGFAVTGRTSPYVEMARPVPLTVEVPEAEDMRALGRRLAVRLGAGDLLVLSGELGAGKTTFTQGLGEGLGVRGGVTSPTFVISRVHPSLVGGPALVHVDAYRLGGRAELDDLDLDTDLADAVTVVEWGSGLAESLADSWLEVRIGRATAAAPGPDLDPRTVELDPVGLRWLGADLRSVVRP